MPNRKFEQFDRQLVLTDLKNRILDMQANPFVVPDVPWDAQPVRYFKLNLQWCKILAGWLEWMEDVAGWQDAEDDLHAGIQGFLEFERGINGGIFMTPDEFKQALRDGLYQWSNDVAKQIVSGTTFGFSVDEDGNVVPGGDTAGDIPDDPATPQNEALERQNGIAITTALGYKSLYDKCFALFGIDSVADTPLADAQFIIRNSFHCDFIPMDAAVAEYYDIRTALFSDYVALNADAMAEVLFCNNMDDQALNGYILELAAPSLNARKNIVNLFEALSVEQLAAWEIIGGKAPSTEYFVYGCVPIPDEEFVLNMAAAENPEYITSGIWKAGHRYLITVSGTFTNPANPTLISDGMYAHDTSTGIKAFSSLNFNFSGGSVPNPVQAQVPFNDAHFYRFTVEKAIGTGNANGIISKNSGAMNLPGTTGVLTVTVRDLGQFDV